MDTNATILISDIGTFGAISSLIINPGSIIAVLLLLFIFTIIIISKIRRFHTTNVNKSIMQEAKQFVDFSIAAQYLKISDDFCLRYTKFSDRPEYPCLTNNLAIYVRLDGRHVIDADDLEVFVKRVLRFWKYDEIDGE